MQTNYRARLAKMFVVNAGPIVRLLWGMAQAFMDDVTVSKIFLSTSPDPPELQDLVRPNQRLKSFGGTCELPERPWPPVMPEGDNREDYDAEHESEDAFRQRLGTNPKLLPSPDLAAFARANNRGSKKKGNFPHKTYYFPDRIERRDSFNGLIPSAPESNPQPNPDSDSAPVSAPLLLPMPMPLPATVVEPMDVKADQSAPVPKQAIAAPTLIVCNEDKKGPGDDHNAATNGVSATATSPKLELLPDTATGSEANALKLQHGQLNPIEKAEKLSNDTMTAQAREKDKEKERETGKAMNNLPSIDNVGKAEEAVNADNVNIEVEQAHHKSHRPPNLLQDCDAVNAPKAELAQEQPRDTTRGVRPQTDPNPRTNSPAKSSGAQDPPKSKGNPCCACAIF